MTESRDATKALFIVAASSRLARARVERVAIGGLDALRHQPTAEALQAIDGHRNADGRLRAWSIHGSSRFDTWWQALTEGDWFLFYQRGFFSAAGLVSGKVESPDIAAAIWGNSEAEELKRVIFFGEVHAVWARAWEQSDVLGSRFLGFRRLADAKQQAIRQRWGSVDSFVRQAILPQRAEDQRPRRR